MALKSRRVERRTLTALRAFLPYVEVVEFRDDAATHYAQIRADLKKRGQMIGANDLLIAAHARGLGFALVTNNTAEFGRVKGLRDRELDAARSSCARERGIDGTGRDGPARRRVPGYRQIATGLRFPRERAA